MHIKLYNIDKQNGGIKMFGLSTHEVEMKNVYAAYSNNINIYYESLKDGLTVKLSENIGNFEKLFENSAKLYFDSSKDSLFKYLRTQYKEIGRASCRERV